MKNDGSYIKSFFANSRYINDNGSILAGVSSMALPSEGADVGAQIASADVQAAVLELEAFLGRHLTGPQPFGYFTINYDEIRKLAPVANRSNSGDYPGFIHWLAENQFPVVHLVRKNPLDCFVDQLIQESQEMSDDDIPLLDLVSAVSTIRQMQTDVEEFRNWLVGTNRIEFYSESLFDEHDRPSQLVVHQLAKHLGIASREFFAESSLPKSNLDEMRVAAQIKSQLRPALLRAGYENLYELPRAA